MKPSNIPTWETARAAKRIAVLALACLLGASAVGAGCARRAERPPVVLISIDTCRPDRLGCYGQRRPLTPNIDSFAGGAVLYSSVTAAVPLTLPSHCTMLTGVDPNRHGVHDNAGYRLADSVMTLAERLKEGGYETGAVIGSFALDHRFGLAQGFDWYEDRIPVVPGRPKVEENERPAAEVTRLASEWLGRRGSKPFFLFVHYYDPHAPYAPPEPFASRFPDDPYGAEIASVDEAIGRLLGDLRKGNRYDRALIIITSDHGESLGEHGEMGHSYFVYDATVHVPLLIKVPRGSSRSRDERTAGLIDIVSTVCRYAGVDGPPGAEGLDLSIPPGASGAPSESRAIYVESLTPTRYDAAPLRGVVSGRWKYILSERSELYDRRQDPGETVNLLAREPATAKRLNGLLEALIVRANATASPRSGGTGSGSAAAIDEETRERLASLGYISGRAVNEELRPTPGLADPKDRIDVHEAFQSALERMGAGDFAGAFERCRGVAEKLPGLPDAYLLSADVAVAAGQAERAIADYRHYLELAASAKRPASDLARGWFNLGNVLASTPDRDEAIASYRRAAALEPQNADVWFNLGVTQAEAGQVREAVESFTRAVAVDSLHAEAQFNLGLARAVLGDAAAAAEACRAALRASPNHPGATMQLARTELHTGMATTAVERLRRTLAAHPEQVEIAQLLAWVLATHEDPKVRDGGEAEKIAQLRVNASGGRDPRFLEILAAAKAEQGRYADAASLQARAMALVPPGTPDGVQRGMNEHLDLYRQGRPVRNRF